MKDAEKEKYILKINSELEKLRQRLVRIPIGGVEWYETQGRIWGLLYALEVLRGLV